MRESLARAVLWAIIGVHGERTRVPEVRRFRLEDRGAGGRFRRRALRLPVRRAGPPAGRKRRHPAALPPARISRISFCRATIPWRTRELAHVLLTREDVRARVPQREAARAAAHRRPGHRQDAPGRGRAAAPDHARLRGPVLRLPEPARPHPLRLRRQLRGRATAKPTALRWIPRCCCWTTWARTASRTGWRTPSPPSSPTAATTASRSSPPPTCRTPMPAAVRSPDRSTTPGKIEYRTTLADRIGSRARSRLFEMCKVVRMPLIEDFRLRKANSL